MAKKGKIFKNLGKNALKFENILKTGPGKGLVVSVEHQQMS